MKYTPDGINLFTQIIASPQYEGAVRISTIPAAEAWIKDKARKFPMMVYVPGADAINFKDGSNFDELRKTYRAVLAKQGFVDIKES